MKVALVQLDVDLTLEPETARGRAIAKVHEAAEDGAELVVLPELWLHGAFDPEPWPTTAEPLHGETAHLLREAAMDCGITLHGGSIVERTPDGKLYNTSLVFDAEGEMLAGYRKIHRFGFDEGEAAVMSAGSHITTFPLRDLDDSVLTEVGLATCYDARFPELYRKLLDAGAQTLIQVSAWPAARRSHLLTLLRARAIENQMYILACTAAGKQGSIEMAAHSIVLDPWGETVAAAGDEPTILFADIDPELVPKTRDRFPVLRDRVL